MADVFCLSPLFFVFLQSFRAVVHTKAEMQGGAVLASDNEKIIKKHHNERFIQMA